MSPKTQLSIVLVSVVILLALVSSAGATQMSWNGNNASNVDNIWDSLGMSYLKNSTGMSNPATADLNMGNYNITGLGQNESYSYLIWTDGTNYYAKNGSAGKIDYSGANGNTVVTSAFSKGAISYKFACGNFVLTGNAISLPYNSKISGSGLCTQLYQGNDNDLFYQVGLGGNGLGNTIIENMYLGSSATSVGKSLLNLTNSHRNIIRNVVLTGGYYGVYNHGSLLNVYENLKSGGNVGLFFTDISTNHDWVYDDSFNGISPNANLYLNPIIEGGTNGINHTSSQNEGDMTIVGGTFENIPGTALRMVGTLSPIVIQNSHFEANGYDIYSTSDSINIYSSHIGSNHINSTFTGQYNSFNNVLFYGNVSIYGDYNSMCNVRWGSISHIINLPISVVNCDGTIWNGTAWVEQYAPAYSATNYLTGNYYLSSLYVTGSTIHAGTGDSLVFGTEGLNQLQISTTDGRSNTGIVIGSTGLLFPIQLSTSVTYQKGGIFYNDTLSKGLIGGASGWETVCSGSDCPNATVAANSANWLLNVSIPSTSSSACTTGQVAYNSSYFYSCVATNTWVRANMSTW